MTRDFNGNRGPMKRYSRQMNGALARVMAFGGLIFVAGCSQVPDALNPAEWYKSVEQAITGDEDTSGPQPNASGAALPEAAANATPTPPPGGLVADVDGRRYAEEIPRQGAAVNALSPTTAVASAPEQPAPPAQPKPPVTTEAVGTPQMPALVQPVTAPKPAAAPAAPSAPEVQTAAVPQSPQLVITDASQAAYQARLDAMRAKLNARGQGSTPSLTAAPGARYDELVGSVEETVIVSGDGIAFNRPSQAMQVASTGGPDALAIGDYGQVTPEGTRVATILFPNGSARLSGRDREILSQVARLLDAQGGRLQVIGHSSSRTRNMTPDRHRAVNMQLSITRAERVASELRRLGVQEAALSVGAKGDQQPVYYEIMPAGEAGNRRAEIYLIN